MITLVDLIGAACVGEDPLLFDLDAHHHGRLGGWNSCMMCDDARDICAYCPVRAECFDLGRELRGTGLVWGGYAFAKGRPRPL